MTLARHLFAARPVDEGSDGADHCVSVVGFGNDIPLDDNYEQCGVGAIGQRGDRIFPAGIGSKAHSSPM